MDLDREIIDHFAADLRAKGKKPSTIESYCRDASDFLRFLDSRDLNIQDVAPETLIAYQEYLSTCDRENSIRRKVIGTRQFFRFFSDQKGHLDSPFDHVPIPERDEQLPDRLPTSKLQKMILQLEAKSGLKARRNLAILYLLGYEGLKATELIDLNWSDWLKTASHGSLRIRGGRTRTIIPIPSTQHAIEVYREEVDALEIRAKRKFQRMFIAFKGRDECLILDQMSRHGLKFLIYELGEQAGFPKLNTEVLRHHAVQLMLKNGQTPEEIMNHFGLRRLGNIAKHAHQLAKSLDS